MKLIDSLVEALTPISYPTIEFYANQAGIDFSELMKTTKAILEDKGKVEAIYHVNEILSPKSSLPLPSTKAFVDSLG